MYRRVGQRTGKEYLRQVVRYCYRQLYRSFCRIYPVNQRFDDVNDPQITELIGEKDADKLRQDLELIEGVYSPFDKGEYLQGELAPVFFGSALNTFGVKELLECFVQIAPSPRPIEALERRVDPMEEKFTGFCFKIHAKAI